MATKDSEFYAKQAVEARQAAAAAALDNERARHLAAAQAWDRLAQRSLRAGRRRPDPAPEDVLGS